MPILACRCEECSTKFDYLSFGAADQPECPDCRSRKVERLFAPFAVGAATVPASADCACPGGPGACPHPCSRALAGV
ncbi:MAG: FmdB family zinc ribbon protein [Candidatus Coatesbacteria bacterium]